MIEVTDLYKYYGEHKAVGPLSFTIASGEIVGLLGLNGAGKTTTLRILSCDLLPSSGTVRVDGMDVVEQPYDVRARVGYLPDTPPLYGDMSVREFLRFAARLRGLSGGEASSRVAEVCRLTELFDVENDLISSLSHGFRQRVGIAQAIVHKPKLLVLDEPISGLDPVQIVEMRKLLLSLKGEHTILLSSHILSEISETCDRLLVIRDGEIGAQGTEAELSGKMLSSFRIQLSLRGKVFEQAKELLSKLSGVTAVEKADAAEAGACALLVEAERDVRPEVSAALVQAGLSLLSLGRSERELESVFIKLAKGYEAPKAMAAEAEEEEAEGGDEGEAEGGDADESDAGEGGEEGSDEKKSNEEGGA